MKKLYTLLAIVLIGFIGNAQIVTIPDGNFNANIFAAGTSQDIASTQPPVYNAVTGIWSMPTSWVSIDTNSDGQIQVSEAQAIKCLNITGYNVNDLTGIEAFTNLQYLDCSNNALASLNVLGLSNLKYLNCVGNQLTALNVSGLSNLKYLTCVFNQLTSLNLSGLTNITEINCSENRLATINLSGLSNLKYFSCGGNNFTSLNFSAVPSLLSIDCGTNQLTSLSVSGLTNLQSLYCHYNQLASIDVSGLTNLKTLYCAYNQLTNLNITTNGLLTMLDCQNNQLNTLLVKNNCPTTWGFISLQGNPNLTYICCDEQDIAYVQGQVNTAGYSATCNVGSYCSFTPGGTFYTLQGTTRFDGNANGCDAADSTISHLKFNASIGAVFGIIIPNTTGSYSIPVQAGTSTITPVLENPDYFIVSPASSIVTFPSSASPYTQNFCVTANGIKNDLEIEILPIGFARPGFDANYKIIYSNKGNQTANGTLSLNFNDAVMDLVSATPSNNSAGINSLNWNFTNMSPYETREISVKFNINSPTETPPVNSGTVLSYTTTIVGAADETPNDNNFTLNQIVVNSLDPNDKTCLEGTTITPAMIGNYMHYMIRFENTGTFAAQNVVIKDLIDTTKFDIASLVPISSSHNFVTKISNTNKVEFIFENINLPFNDANNDGYVAFKIKTKPTLVVGDTFSNTASIYFDFNFPIVTNTASTLVTALGTPDFEFSDMFSLSPVPAKDSLSIVTKQEVSITSVSIYNTLGQLVQVNTNPNEIIDVSGLKTGNYFIKVISDKGTASSKFIKD